MTQKSEETRTSPELDAVSSECLNLLIVYYSYQQLIKVNDPNAGTRFDLHRWWISLRVFENDIIMRLCRLDDDEKSNHSLREALRSVRNKIPSPALASLEKNIKEYRQAINPIKTKARNYFLAHMSKSASAPYDPQGGLERPIEMVVNLVDAIAGRKINYHLSVGSKEACLNLRHELSRL